MHSPIKILLDFETETEPPSLTVRGNPARPEIRLSTSPILTLPC
jgi:hypothetical protein